MSFEEQVVVVLEAVPPRRREDVCMLGVWLTARGTAVVGSNTSSRLRANGTALGHAVAFIVDGELAPCSA